MDDLARGNEGNGLAAQTMRTPAIVLLELMQPTMQPDWLY